MDHDVQIGEVLSEEFQDLVIRTGQHSCNTRIYRKMFCGKPKLFWNLLYTFPMANMIYTYSLMFCHLWL